MGRLPPMLCKPHRAPECPKCMEMKMPGKCEHGLTTRECLVCASPKRGAPNHNTHITIPTARLIELETAEHERDIFRAERLDLALLVGRLIRRMRAARTGEGMAAGDDALEQQCIGYLRRKGLTSPLREETPNAKLTGSQQR